MTFSYFQNGIYYSTIYGGRFESIIPVILRPEYRCSRITFKLFSSCPEDKALYITLWDENNIIHQFIFYGASNTLDNDFPSKLNNIVDTINDKLSE